MTSVRPASEPRFCDEPSIQHALRVMLVTMFVSILAIAAFTLYVGWRLTPRLCLAAAASCLAPLVISRSGSITRTMLIPLLTITYVVIHLAANKEGIHNIGLATLPVLIAVGSLVLDRLSQVLLTAAMNLAVVGMLAIRYFVTREQRFSMDDVGDFFVFMVTCAAATVVGRVLAVRIEDGFRRIRDSERRYRGIFENVQDVYYEMQPDGTLVEVSPASAALFGVPREELIGRRVPPLCVNPSEFDDLLAAIRAQGRVSNRELVIRDSSAALHHVLVNASLQPASETGEERVIGSIRDITDRKRAEEALRESERTFRELLENIQLAALITDLEGKITFCNDYALDLTGWTREELIGLEAKELLHPESLFLASDEKAVAPASGRRQSFVEGSILEKSGGRRSIQWSGTLIRDSAGRIAGFASLGEDVTELRALRTEAARRESEEQFREVANAAPLAIWTTDPDKLCTFVNKAWLAFTGRTLEQELGYGWMDAIHPEDRERAIAECSAGFEKRHSIHVEYRKRRADGEYRWVLGIGVPRLGSNGEFKGYIGTCTDITHVKNRHEEAVIRQKWESLGTLAGGIAHDFNNILGGILSQTELALAELAGGEPADAEIRVIQTVALRGAEIVRQLITHAGQKENEIELVDFSRLMKDSLELLKVVVSKHAVLDVRMAPDTPPVRGNPGALRQILLNLVTNASEAIGDRDGVIQVKTSRVRLEPHARSNGSELAPGDYLQIEVSDTGCGIPPENQSKVFDPFFTTKSPGHGLGLAVVQGIVRRLGGAVTVRSSPSGSAFRILLPAAAEAAEDRERPADTGDQRALDGGTILLVEDEEPLRAPIARLLQKSGYRVLEARDGSEALSLLRIHASELTAMVLDVSLPGVASPEVFRAARRLSPDLRVVVTSAYSEETVANTFGGLPALRFLRKPMRIADLLKLLG
jgi:PAS domain S-box-containing protein